MNFTETESYTYNGEQKEYHYATTATIPEQIAFIESVSDGVFINGNFIPLLKEPVFNYALIGAFTDIDLTQFVGIDEFDAFDKQTGISRDLAGYINYSIYNSLKTSIDANIEYKKSIAHDNISTAIVEFINVAKEKVEAFGEELNSDIVMDFIQKFGQSGIDSESIVKAYLNSAQYKENVAKVLDAKNDEIRALKQKLNQVTSRNVVADKSDKVVPIKGK